MGINPYGKIRFLTKIRTQNILLLGTFLVFALRKKNKINMIIPKLNGSHVSAELIIKAISLFYM